MPFGNIPSNDFMSCSFSSDFYYDDYSGGSISLPVRYSYLWINSDENANFCAASMLLSYSLIKYY